MAQTSIKTIEINGASILMRVDGAELSDGYLGELRGYPVLQIISRIFQYIDPSRDIELKFCRQLLCIMFEGNPPSYVSVSVLMDRFQQLKRSAANSEPSTVKRSSKKHIRELISKRAEDKVEMTRESLRDFNAKLVRDQIEKARLSSKRYMNREYQGVFVDEVLPRRNVKVKGTYLVKYAPCPVSVYVRVTSSLPIVSVIPSSQERISLKRKRSNRCSNNNRKIRQSGDLRLRVAFKGYRKRCSRDFGHALIGGKISAPVEEPKIVTKTKRSRRESHVRRLIKWFEEKKRKELIKQEKEKEDLRIQQSVKVKRDIKLVIMTEKEKQDLADAQVNFNLDFNDNYKQKPNLLTRRDLYEACDGARTKRMQMERMILDNDRARKILEQREKECYQREKDLALRKKEMRATLIPKVSLSDF